MGLAHFFFAPNPYEDLQDDIQQQLTELDSALDLVAVEQPGGERCGSSSTIPQVSTWPSANGSPSTSTTCWPTTRWRSLRRARVPPNSPVPETKETSQQRDRRRSQGARAGEGDLRRQADGRARRRAPLRVQEDPGAAKYARVDLDHETGDFRVFELILPPELEEKLLAEAAEAQEEEERQVDPETGELREPEEPELDPEMIAPYEDQISTRDVTPEDFGRIAAQTAKQVILQRIREAERMMMFDEYQDRVGELITGIIQQSDKRYTLVQLRERVEALLPKSEQVYNERYDHGMRVKAVITDVSDSTKGPAIVVSRRSPELIKSLFELEVPEIADKLVEIVGVAREPGYRSKIAVISHADGVDPVGACVGPRGSRVRMVVSELRGEKIDIIPHNDEPGRFVAKALSPARVREVIVDDEERQATVIVPDDQLSLAIGRDGQNARLAARLTGWRVDIKSETEFAQDDEEIEYEGEEQSDGRCLAVLSNGRRCPNAAIADSTYCGLPQHQALSRFETNQIAVLAPLAEAEIAILADPAADEGQVSELVERAEAAFVEPVTEAEEDTVEEVDAEDPAAESTEAEAPGDESSEAPAAGPDTASEEPAVGDSASVVDSSEPAPTADEESEGTPPEDEAAEASGEDSEVGQPEDETS